MQMIGRQELTDLYDQTLGSVEDLPSSIFAVEKSDY